MKTTHRINIGGVERDLVLCKLNDSLQIGAFIVIGDYELSEACARELLKVAPEYDYILTAETKGIPIAHEMARQTGARYHIVARKAKKLYMKEVFEVNVRSITTEKDQMLYLDKKDADLMKGKKILIVDDVISTGESLRALEELVKAAGGAVAAKMAVLAEGDAQEREDIIFLEKLPLFDREGTPIA